MDVAALDAVRLDFDPDKLWMLNGVIALIMFGVALDLRTEDFRRIFESPKGPLIGLVAQFLLLPAATFVLTLVLRPAPSIALGMMLVAACPGGNLSNFLTHLARGNTALSVTMTAVSTAAATVMTPLNVSIWGRLNPRTAPILEQIQISYLDLFLTVMLILGLPLVVGMACARTMPRVAKALHIPLKYFSIVFFLVFVVFLFTRNYDVFTNYIHWVAAAVVIHNVVAFSTGYGMGRASGLPPRDCRAVAIEVGIQNSALGLTLIFQFFAGLGGMALVAGAWGIWHIIAGLAVASIWSRRPVEVATAQAAEAAA